MLYDLLIFAAGVTAGVIIIGVLTGSKLKNAKKEMLTWRKMYFELLEHHGIPHEHTNIGAGCWQKDNIESNSRNRERRCP